MYRIIMTVGCGFAFLAALFLASCDENDTVNSAPEDAAPGDRIELNDVFHFYFYNPSPNAVGQDVINPPETIVQKVSEAAIWTAPEGFRIENRTLNITPHTLKWGNAAESYSAPGFELSVAAVIWIDQNAQPGAASVEVTLPNLVALATVLGAEVVFPYSSGISPPYKLELGTYTVYESRSALDQRQRRDLFIVIAIVSAVIGMFLIVAFTEKRASTAQSRKGPGNSP